MHSGPDPAWLAVTAVISKDSLWGWRTVTNVTINYFFSLKSRQKCWEPPKNILIHGVCTKRAQREHKDHERQQREAISRHSHRRISLLTREHKETSFMLLTHKWGSLMHSEWTLSERLHSAVWALTLHLECQISFGACTRSAEHHSPEWKCLKHLISIALSHFA